MSKRAARKPEYDVCLSFAGEDRPYVQQVAAALRLAGVRVFYDEYEQVNLWGKDLYSHLDDIYQNAARYCVLFASRSYAKKVWTNHERQSAQARAIRENREYILPAKFDGTKIPGVRDTVGHINLQSMSPDSFAKIIIKKLGPRDYSNYMPPIPDLLLKQLKLRSRKSQDIATLRAHDFFHSLKRMALEERLVILNLFFFACPDELPENVHIDLDLLRRETGKSPTALVRVLRGLSSLGYSVRFDSRKASEGQGRAFVEYFNASTDDDICGNCTSMVAAIMAVMRSHRCESCAMKALLNLDFGDLSSATAISEIHEKST